MRTFVGSIQRNTEDIFPLFLANLANQGIDKCVVVIHNNPLEPYEEISERFRNRIEISLVSYQSEAFYQGTIMTLLARLAKTEGYELFMPLDGDEFIDQVGHSDLKESLVKAFASEKIAALRVPVRSYLQNSSIIKFNSDRTSIEGCRYSYRKSPEHEESNFMGKIVVNLTRATEFRIEEGNHGIQGLQPDSIANERSILIRHLPNRDRIQLETRRLQGQSLEAGKFPQGIGFHNRELIALSELELDEFWKKKSWSQENTPPSLVEDLSLIDLLLTCLTIYEDLPPASRSIAPYSEERKLLSLAIEDAGQLTLLNNINPAKKVIRQILEYIKR